jgi:hypothetical protein
MLIETFLIWFMIMNDYIHKKDLDCTSDKHYNWECELLQLLDI